jgi:hypothetical protein
MSAHSDRRGGRRDPNNGVEMTPDRDQCPRTGAGAMVPHDGVLRAPRDQGAVTTGTGIARLGVSSEQHAARVTACAAAQLSRIVIGSQTRPSGTAERCDRVCARHAGARHGRARPPVGMGSRGVAAVCPFGIQTRDRAFRSGHHRLRQDLDLTRVRGGWRLRPSNSSPSWILYAHGTHAELAEQCLPDGRPVRQAVTWSPDRPLLVGVCSKANLCRTL